MDNRQFFAQLDENNIVIDVRVVNKDFLEANPERYQGRWVETFFDAPNKSYAGIGFTYIDEIDNFVGPQPFPSWSLNSNYVWQAPVPKPNEHCYWDENSLSWKEIIIEA